MSMKGDKSVQSKQSRVPAPVCQDFVLRSYHEPNTYWDAA